MPRTIRRPVASVVDDGPDPLDVIDGVEYPSSDGKPMAESEIHFQTIVLLYQILHHYYRADTSVHVVGNIMLYWEQGNPRACGSPDVMVSFGVRGKHPRRSFICWKEGVVPSVAFEIASPRTWRARLGKTKNDYERAGIREYFIFDPERRYIREGLLGFRLKNKRYIPIAQRRDGTMRSRELKLLLVPSGNDLRVADSETGRWLLTQAEEQQQRAEAARVRAEEQQHRAEVQQQRAEEQQHRADALQQEVSRLRALLEQRDGKVNGAHHS